MCCDTPTATHDWMLRPWWMEAAVLIVIYGRLVVEAMVHRCDARTSVTALALNTSGLKMVAKRGAMPRVSQTVTLFVSAGMSGNLTFFES
jgi:hypothetical protein